MQPPLTYCADNYSPAQRRVIEGGASIVTLKPVLDINLVLSTERQGNEKSSAKERSTNKKTVSPCTGNSPRRAAAASPQEQGLH